MTDITPERLAEIKERVRFAFATAIGLMSAGSLRLADAYIQDIPDLIAALEAAQAENANLRAALRPFAMYPDDPSMGDHKMTGSRISYGIIRAAHAALESNP